MYCVKLWEKIWNLFAFYCEIKYYAVGVDVKLYYQDANHLAPIFFLLAKCAVKKEALLSTTRFNGINNKWREWSEMSNLLGFEVKNIVILHPIVTSKVF